MRPQSRVELVQTFYSPFEARALAAPTSQLPEERECVADSGASMHMLSKNNSSTDKTDTLKRSRPSTVVMTANGEVQTFEEAQKICSRSWFIRDTEITRWNACCFIAWKSLRRPRIFLWVGQRTKATLDQWRKDNYLQDWIPRTSCGSRIVRQFRKHYVIDVAVKGSVFKRSNRRTTWGNSFGKPT